MLKLTKSGVCIGFAVALLGCGASEDFDNLDDGKPVFSVVASALNACSGEESAPFDEITSMRVIVRKLSGLEPDQNPISFDTTFGGGTGGKVTVDDVPEGLDEEVTLIGIDKAGAPSWFARKKHVVVQQGKNNDVQMILSRFGGYSCPKAPTEYTHRLLPTVTPLGGGQYFVAGGLTAVTDKSADGSQAKFVTNTSARRAFVYDAVTGEMKKVQSEMVYERGAHTAVLVIGTEMNRILFFGGTQALKYNKAEPNGFAWSYDTKDAISFVDIFEYKSGTNPQNGKFVDQATAGADHVLKQKRVFPTANTINTSGLVMICGGGQWGVEKKPTEYKECEIWDATAGGRLDFANNYMNFYRTGMAAQPYEEGEVVKLLYVGGVTNGPPIELYTANTKQRDLTGGSFAEVLIEDFPQVFFPQLTPIGDKRFVMTGGVNWNGTTFDEPSENNAWLLKVVPINGGNYVIGERIGGLGVGRYFHSAQAPSNELVTVVGGFTGNALEPTSDVRFLQKIIEGTKEDFEFRSPPETELPWSVARGGVVSQLLENDTILLVGGISEPSDLEVDQFGAVEVYTPSQLYDAKEGVR